MAAIQKNNVNVYGDAGSTLVFVHGYGCDQNMWRYVAPEFSKAHKTVLYDLTGMGKSDFGAYDFDEYRDLRAHAKDLVAILEELAINQAVLVGHSVGATIACLAALDCPDRVKALALVAPSPCFINDDGYVGGFDRESIEGLIDMMEQNFLGWTAQVAPTIAGQDEDGATTTELTQSFCRTDPAIAKHFGRVTFHVDHRREMAQVAIPALILQCSDDALAPTDVGTWLSEQMSGGYLKVIEATGHCPHMTEPDKTIEALRELLERLN